MTLKIQNNGAPRHYRRLDEVLVVMSEGIETNSENTLEWENGIAY
jgi:hypothetical protein